jgi:16S rRNA (adenine1518-N6/adenine1519-N6)-dimethyltransferase
MTEPEPSNPDFSTPNEAEVNEAGANQTGVNEIKGDATSANQAVADSVYRSPKNPPRQTASYLSKRLMAAGLRPVSHFGQNFLIDLNLIDLIARSAELRTTDVVLEIGTGVGSLTTRLSDNAGAVLTVEIDHNLHRLASEELGGRPNVKLLQCDALKNKNTLRPEIMENIRDAMNRIGDGARFMLVANLPYNVATPIISNLLHELPPPDRMVVTIQKELAERMCATPKTKDYSALSVWIQSLCKPPQSVLAAAQSRLGDSETRFCSSVA